ncbi:MAG: preprotein translocase subunit SecG [Gammaproteobacteria bacterium RIFCSPHIGHO2_12_FULL_37_34]|nr:MAG: preprotein translocase subunit SecG [Gammaproteobacteria bacterium RIFCSPHIGHO2_12_FULL_37_34]
MYQIVMFFHILTAALLVALVLVQQGKGATLGAAFGSGASQTVFGSRGSGSFLFRITMGLIAIFFVTSLALNYLSTTAYKQVKVITLPAIPLQQQQNTSTNAMTPGQIPVPR